MTCTESQHWDQVPSGSLTFKTHGLNTGLLVTEGSHGRTESQDEVGTSGHNDKNQKAAYEQPQKAFTPNALSHTMLGRGDIQTLPLKTLNTVQH